jgi:hypothetical protein
MCKDSAANCNEVSFPPIVVASGYFGYVGCTWLLLVLFGLLVVAAMSVLVATRFLLYVFFEWGGTKSTRYCGHFWPIVQAPDGR